MAKETMKAIRFHEYGGPEKLVLDDIERPHTKANEVLVRMKSAGVNPADWKIRAGYMKAFRPVPLPWIPGLDGAGVVEEAGPDVTAFKRGQGVFGVITGSYAEYAIAQASDLVEKPLDISFDQGAAVPIGALTAWNAVVEVAKPQPGQRVLVLGAAGGVGLFAVQLARWLGAHVIGTSSKVNLEFIRSLGAETAIDYQEAPLEKQAREIDVVIDTVGGESFERSWLTLKKGGLAVTVVAQIPEEKAGELGIRAQRAGRASPENLAKIAELIGTKTIRPVVGRVLRGLEQARSAHELSQSGHGRGRIVLHIAD